MVAVGSAVFEVAKRDNRLLLKVWVASLPLSVLQDLPSEEIRVCLASLRQPVEQEVDYSVCLTSEQRELIWKGP